VVFESHRVEIFQQEVDLAEFDGKRLIVHFQSFRGGFASTTMTEAGAVRNRSGGGAA